MANYKTADIRNVALVGHGGTGKTTLADLFLFKTGVKTRAGSVDDGSSIFDIDDEEKERKSSITSSLGHFTHNGKRINLIDTPGYPDFIGQATGAIAAVETALCLISATSGIEVNTRRTFQLAGDAGIGRAIALNRCGLENIDFAQVIADIQDSFGQQCIPINVPNAVGPAFTSVQSTLGGDSEYSQALTDCIVEADEALMEKFLETEELSPADAVAGITKAIASGTLVPIFCVSGRQDIGVSELLDGIASMFPSPADIDRAAEDGSKIKADPNGPLAARIFKTRIDPFVARMNFVRVYSGTLKKDTTVKNQSTDKTAKISTLNEVQGGELNAMHEVIAGDLAAIVKVDGLHVGDSLGDVKLPAMPFPRPMVGWAIEPKTSADQQKISGAIQKLQDEDPTFIVVRDQQTKELVIYGMSELHLQIVIERMLNRDKVGVNTRSPKIPYRETCTGSAEGHYRHKKQSGGSGQFAEVHLKIDAVPKDIDPDEHFTKARFDSMRSFHYDPVLNYAFVDRVTGGTVPNNFIPAVEKGIKERMERGVLAGYQVQDVACALFFGKDHPVDSNETAFKMAASMCFREVFKQAKPVLLEPIVAIEITIPADKLGDITSDLTTRRGRMEGMDAAPGGLQVVKGMVPLAEVQDYARGLSSITGGQGSYTYEPSHYEVVPANEQQKIIAAAEKEKEEES